MDKAALRENLLKQLRADLSQQAGAALLARDEAISEESRPESKYDTHSQEAAYLAEGQARIAAEIAASIEFYRAFDLPPLPPGSAVAPGALVQLDGADGPAWYFLGPRAGGVEFGHDDLRILVITPHSPLGRALLGRREGDSVYPGARSAAHRISSVY